MTTKDIAKAFGCTEEQLKAQYAANAARMRLLLEKAKSTGKPVRGFTEAELAERVAKLEQLSQ